MQALCLLACASVFKERTQLHSNSESDISVQCRAMRGQLYAPTILVPVEAGAVTTSVGSWLDLRAGLGVVEER